MKKFLAILLAAVMLLGCAAAVHAEDRVGADPALVEAAKAEAILRSKVEPLQRHPQVAEPVSAVGMGTMEAI